jgi:lipopolysaccharide assembly outer membrane protein LptD (OstA)
MNWVYRVCLAVAVPCFALVTNISAQSPPVAPTIATPEKKALRWVKTTGEMYSYKETPQGKIHRFEKNVVFTSEDTRLTTDLATFSETTQIATSPGKMKIEDTNNSIVGDTGIAYYKTRDAKIRGNVTIVAKPSPEDQTAPEGSSRRQFDAPAAVTCDNVDYNWHTRIAIATGHLTMKQKDRVVTADRAVVDGRQEQVTLDGNVVFTNSKGERATSPKVVIVYKKGDEKFTATGGVKGTFSIQDEDEQAPTDAGSKPVTPPGGAPPGTTPPAPAPSTPAPPEPKPQDPGTTKP